jgi:hypothetical protein
VSLDAIRMRGSFPALLGGVFQYLIEVFLRCNCTGDGYSLYSSSMFQIFRNFLFLTL